MGESQRKVERELLVFSGFSETGEHLAYSLAYS